MVLQVSQNGLFGSLVSKELDRSVHGPLAKDIKQLLGSFDYYLVKHVRRSCNEVAHRLAREGCANNLCKTWRGVPPAWLSNLLAFDAGD